MGSGAQQGKAGILLTQLFHVGKQLAVILHPDNRQVEKRPHGRYHHIWIVQINSMAGDEQCIRAQRVAGTDHGAQIAAIGRTVKQHQKRIGGKLQAVQPVRAHLDDGHQLRGILLAAEIPHQFRGQAVIDLRGRLTDHIPGPAGQIVFIIQESVDLPAVLHRFVKTAHPFH